jgi:hypothetical protein
MDVTITGSTHVIVKPRSRFLGTASLTGEAVKHLGATTQYDSLPTTTFYHDMTRL